MSGGILEQPHSDSSTPRLIYFNHGIVGRKHSIHSKAREQNGRQRFYNVTFDSVRV